MNSIDKPDRCEYGDCNNKAYAKDKLTAVNWIWVCKKHHFQCAYGIDYPRETVRGNMKSKVNKATKVKQVKHEEDIRYQTYELGNFHLYHIECTCGIDITGWTKEEAETNYNKHQTTTKVKR